MSTFIISNMMNLKSMKKKLVEKGISEFRCSFVFLVMVSLWTCEFLMTGHGIEMLYKGFGWVPGDWRW
ncbi:hypothetical protein RIR_jg7073.t1 [Rhizophagus irregularis DAOM 181602=DAOM 197198]|nr:hypothetical protein RIR_jg7073.t1 [Rhizophagus irregularis DAOM 181602=DAOM 197198]